MLHLMNISRIFSTNCSPIIFNRTHSIYLLNKIIYRMSLYKNASLLNLKMKFRLAYQKRRKLGFSKLQIDVLLHFGHQLLIVHVSMLENHKIYFKLEYQCEVNLVQYAHFILICLKEIYG